MTTILKFIDMFWQKHLPSLVSCDMCIEHRIYILENANEYNNGKKRKKIV